MEKKYWIDQSEGHPVIMTTDGKMPWKECCKESWKSCKEAGPNITLYQILGLTWISGVMTLILHSILL